MSSPAAPLWRAFAQRVLATYVAMQTELVGMHRRIVEAHKKGGHAVDLESLASSHAVTVELGELLDLHYEVRSKLMEAELLEAKP